MKYDKKHAFNSKSLSYSCLLFENAKSKECRVLKPCIDLN